MKHTIVLLFICLLLVACSGNPQLPASSQTGEYWPTQKWRTSSPEDQGMDGVRLDALIDSIPKEDLDLDSLIVIRHGTIVREAYFHKFKPNQVHKVWSVTKSFISTLVGIAIDKGLLKGTGLTINDFEPEYAETVEPDKRLISLETILTMTTGLDWKESDSSIGNLYRSDNWTAYVFELPMAAKPGTLFNYCSGCTHLLSSALQTVTGMNTQEFAEQNLFAPLGITNYTWETDMNGIPIGGWGLELTPRDMAKLGYLYLQGGEWDGKQVVSSAWIEQATQKHNEGDGKLGYGYLWWIYPRFGAYAALGIEGQTVFVVPDEDLIVVTTATGLDDHEAIFDMIEKDILPTIQGP